MSRQAAKGWPTCATPLFLLALLLDESVPLARQPFAARAFGGWVGAKFPPTRLKRPCELLHARELTAGDGDLRGLVDRGAVLRHERRWHRELLLAQVPDRGEGGVAALGESQFEAADGLVGDRLERRARDPLLTDERAAH